MTASDLHAYHQAVADLVVAHRIECRDCYAPRVVVTCEVVPALPADVCGVCATNPTMVFAEHTTFSGVPCGGSGMAPEDSYDTHKVRVHNAHAFWRENSLLRATGRRSSIGLAIMDLVRLVPVECEALIAMAIEEGQ